MFKFRNVTPSSKEGGCECELENARRLVGGVGNYDFFENFFFLKTFDTAMRKFYMNDKRRFRAQIFALLHISLFPFPSRVLSFRCADVTIFFMIRHKLVTMQL